MLVFLPALMLLFAFIAIFPLFEPGKEIAATELLRIPLGFVLMLLAYKTIKQLYKNAPYVTVNRDHISIGRKQFNTADITCITFTGKHPYSFLTVEFEMEGLYIAFKNGEVFYFYDSQYSNIARLKSFLSITVLKNELSASERYRKISYFSLDKKTLKNYKGHLLLTAFGWVSIIICTYLLFLLLILEMWFFRIFMATALTGFSFLFSRQLFYFAVADRHLVIKNHLFRWSKTVYSFDMLYEVRFEIQQEKGGKIKCLRVTTKDFITKLYPASSLRRKHWEQLKEDLKKQGIPLKYEF